MELNKKAILAEMDKEKLALTMYDLELDDIVDKFTLSELKMLYVRVYAISPRSNASKSELVKSIWGMARSFKRRDAFNR